MVVGPEFEYTFSNRFSLGMGINYSQQGAELDKLDVKYKMHYIQKLILLYVLKKMINLAFILKN